MSLLGNNISENITRHRIFHYLKRQKPEFDVLSEGRSSESKNELYEVVKDPMLTADTHVS